MSNTKKNIVNSTTVSIGTQFHVVAVVVANNFSRETSIFHFSFNNSAKLIRTIIGQFLKGNKIAP